MVTGPGSSVSSAGGARDRGKGQVGQIQPSAVPIVLSKAIVGIYQA